MGASSATKKFKSISESSVLTSSIKQAKFKSMVKQQPQPDSDVATFPLNPARISIFDNEVPDLKQSSLGHPEQPQDEMSPPDLTMKSQTFRLHNSEEQPHVDNVSTISPTKQSF